MSISEIEIKDAIEALDDTLASGKIRVSIEKMTAIGSEHHVTGYFVTAYARTLAPKYGNRISKIVDDDSIVVAMHVAKEIGDQLHLRLEATRTL